MRVDLVGTTLFHGALCIVGSDTLILSKGFCATFGKKNQSLIMFKMTKVAFMSRTVNIDTLTAQNFTFRCSYIWQTCKFWLDNVFFSTQGIFSDPEYPRILLWNTRMEYVKYSWSYSGQNYKPDQPFVIVISFNLRLSWPLEIFGFLGPAEWGGVSNDDITTE